MVEGGFDEIEMGEHRSECENYSLQDLNNEYNKFDFDLDLLVSTKVITCQMLLG